VNGNAKEGDRQPIRREKTSVKLLSQGRKVGGVKAVEYFVEPKGKKHGRPGVKGSWFIHKTESKTLPPVYTDPSVKTMTLRPSKERQFNRKGVTSSMRAAVEGPLEKTGAKKLPAHVAGGGRVRKLWIALEGKSLPFKIAEIEFSRNQQPILDFVNGVVSLSFTPSQWAALPADKRVFFQYRGTRSTGPAGHGY
jgi:hypothetical protein